MALGKRLINTGGAAACLTETTDIFGDSSGVALYSLDYDASDESGTYDGSPTNVDFGVGGQINYGARFNGSSSNIFNSNRSATQTDTISISAWIKTSDTSTSMMVVQTESIWVRSDYILRHDNYNGTGNYRRYNYTQSTVATGDWVHVCVVRDGTSVTLYVNNSPITFDSESTSSNGGVYDGISIGARNRSSDSNKASHFDGDIDQVRIFNRALLTDNNGVNEIATLYAETACVYTSTTDIVNYPTGTTPVAYYKMDNSSEDYSTGGNDGTDTNIEYRFGRFGQAAVFNGSSSKIELPNTSLGITDASNFSISYWFNTNSTTQDHQSVFWANGSNAGARFGSGINSTTQGGDTSVYFGMPINGTFTYINSGTSAFTANTWVHVVCVKSSTTGMSLYVDNVLKATNTGATGSGSATATGKNSIGMYHTASDSLFFNGSIDQVRIYDTALTSSQVTELFEEKQSLDTVTAPTGNLRFDEFWAGYDDGQTNRAEFKSSGQIVDFNTYSEGHAVLNQDPQTSGKYYLEIELVDTSGHDGFGVFNRSTNTVYDDSPYTGKNPVDANYGATLYARGERMYLGNVLQSGFTDLNLGNGDIVCMAVNVDEKRIWWGRRDGLSDSEIVWSNGNPNGGYGGLEVSFVPSDVIVAHASESLSRYSEFKVLNHADMLEPPFNFSYLDGPNTASLTENEANF